MEEFYLGLFLAFQKLNIVDDQAVYITVFLSEGFGGLIIDRIDNLISEFFTGNI